MATGALGWYCPCGTWYPQVGQCGEGDGCQQSFLPATSVAVEAMRLATRLAAMLDRQLGGLPPACVPANIPVPGAGEMLLKLLKREGRCEQPEESCQKAEWREGGHERAGAECGADNRAALKKSSGRSRRKAAVPVERAGGEAAREPACHRSCTDGLAALREEPRAPEAHQTTGALGEPFQARALRGATKKEERKVEEKRRKNQRKEERRAAEKADQADHDLLDAAILAVAAENLASPAVAVGGTLDECQLKGNEGESILMDTATSISAGSGQALEAAGPEPAPGRLEEGVRSEAVCEVSNVVMPTAGTLDWVDWLRGGAAVREGCGLADFLTLHIIKPELRTLRDNSVYDNLNELLEAWRLERRLTDTVANRLTDHIS
jgi:hypothetical protein